MSFQHANGRYYKNLKYKPGQEQCRDCQVLLVPGPVKDKSTNIAPSRLKKHDYQCRACGAAAKKRNKADMKAVMTAHEQTAKVIHEMFADKPKPSLEELEALDREKRRQVNSFAGFLEQEARAKPKRRRRKPKTPVLRKAVHISDEPEGLSPAQVDAELRELLAEIH